MPIEKLYIKKDGEPEFEINDRISGIEAMGITKVAPQLTPKVHQIVGSDGEIDYGAYYAPSTVKAKVYLSGKDIYDYKLLVSELYRCLYSRKAIRIRDEVEPYICYYVYVKPMELSVINFSDATAEIEFSNPSGFRFSILPCDQLTKGEYGMNITNRDGTHGPVQYHFTTGDFWVYNDSDVTVDPYLGRHQFKMMLKCNGKPAIKNATTGTAITLNQNISTSNTFVLNGVDSFLDNQAWGINTDMGYLTMAPGWNHITLSSASNIDVTFSFPFIYL